MLSNLFKIRIPSKYLMKLAIIAILRKVAYKQKFVDLISTGAAHWLLHKWWWNLVQVSHLGGLLWLHWHHFHSRWSTVHLWSWNYRLHLVQLLLQNEISVNYLSFLLDFFVFDLNFFHLFSLHFYAFVEGSSQLGNNV